MESTNTFYPVFEPDQVLTSAHLNQLRKYLAVQDRLSRRLLHGIGTVCGLQISNPATNVITISEGVGITSKGFLIKLANSECKFYRPYEDKVYNEVNCEGQVEGKYDLFLKDDGVTQYSLWELLTQEEEEDIDDNRIEPLSEAPMNMAEMYIILYLEIEDLDMLACFGEDCDEKGIQRTFKARKLLISKSDLLEIIQKTGKHGDNITEADLEDEINAKFNLKPVSIKRLGYDYQTDVKTLSLSDYDTPGMLFQNYESIIKQGCLDVGKALHGTYETYSTVVEDQFTENPFNNFDSPNADSNALYLSVSNAIKDNPFAVQYAYDFLIDLMAAYDEFRKTAFELVTVCCPDCRWFPRHIMLGKAIQPEVQPSIYRHYFIPSPIMNQQKDLYDLVRLYFGRMVKMIEEMNLGVLDFQNIKVTPSGTYSQPISDRAIPFYYNVNDVNKFYKFWNYGKTSRLQANTVLSYHAGNYNLSDLFVREPSFWEYKKYDFLRIEGHVGKKYEDVLSNVMGQRERLNLPIKVIGVKLSRRFQNTNVDVECKFDDLQNLYRMYVMELTCILQEQSDYFKGFDTDFTGEFWQNFLVASHAASTLTQSGGQSQSTINLLSDPPDEMAKSKKPESDDAKGLSSGLRINTNLSGQQIDLTGFQIADKYANIGAMMSDINVTTGQSIYNILWNRFAIGEFDFLARDIFVQAILYPTQIVELIESLIASIPESLDKIDTEPINDIYKALTETAESFKSTILSSLADPEYTVIGNEQIIMYRLDKLIHQCNLRKLVELYEIYLKRIEEVQQLNLFARFAKDHPGMEHMAGVPKGGTFVIVYADKNEKAKEFDQKDIVEELSQRPGFMAAATGYENIVSAGGSFRSRNIKLASDRPKPESDPMTLSHNISNTGSGQSISSHNILATGLNQLSYLNQIHELERGDLWGQVEPKDDLPPDNVVIADFALPYLCCGSCTEIATMVVSQIVFRLDDNVFCKRDNSEHHFMIDPPGGKITGPGVGVSESGKTIFNPSNVPVPNDGVWQENIQLTYLVNNQNIILNISVYNPVLNGFVATQSKQNDDGTVTIDFQYVYNDATDFVLYLQGEELYSGPTPPQQMDFFDLQNGDVLDFSFVAKKGKCESDPLSSSVTVNIEQDVEFYIEYDGNTICNDYQSNVYFFTEPPPDDEHQVVCVKSPYDITVTLGTDEDGRSYFYPYNLPEGDYGFEYRGEEAGIYIAEPIQFSIGVTLLDPIKLVYKITYVSESDKTPSIRWYLTRHGQSEILLTGLKNPYDFNIQFNEGELPAKIRAEVTSEFGCVSHASEDIEPPETAECYNFDVLSCWMEYMTQNFNFDPIEAAINSRNNLDFTGEIPTDINNLLQDLRTSGSCGFSDEGQYYDFEDGCLVEASSRRTLLNCIYNKQGDDVIPGNYNPDGDYKPEELMDFILQYQRTYCCPGQELVITVDPESLEVLSTNEKVKILKARGVTELENKSGEELTLMINETTSGKSFNKNELELLNKKSIENILNNKGIKYSGGDKKRDLINLFGK